ncbi:hypothetical protein RAS1_02490 [Phycisphaerae bacterium RAS1]|nr:hypothetical protein RAS1_02490 [Phycisphaerae bacterium RAS1]
MSLLCAIDTNVLWKANRSPAEQPRPGSEFARRIRFLKAVRDGDVVVLISRMLLNEYMATLKKPVNDLVQLLLQLLVDPKPNRARINWKTPWSGRDRSAARKCRYPKHDEHVLRTAMLENEQSWIATEEKPMLGTNACIYRRFRVHIRRPDQILAEIT